MLKMNKNIFAIIFLIQIFAFCQRNFFSEALTDAQRKEIESLRAELDDAFEKDEERAMREHGVIVQPSWTQDHHSHHKTATKVVVTHKGLDEVKALRDEINKAVKQDSYTPLVGRGHIGADTHIVQELHHKYENNTNNQRVQMVSAAQNQNEAEEPTTTTTTAPNVVEANLEPEIDIRKLQRLELSKRRTKEALVLESIEEDFSFTQGEHVLEWEHILHGGQEYFIGRLPQALQIVHKNALKYEAGEILHIGAPITYLETYSFWNSEKQQQEGIILVATGSKVLWYRADEASAQIQLYWEWMVGNAITGLTYFAADGAQDYLVISSNQSSLAGYFALNIYQFDLKHKEFWIAQRMQMHDACGEVTFLNTGRDYILAVPQNNSAMIFTFNPNTDTSGHIRFQQKFKFESEGIEYITAFQMGGRSYLALGGLQPQILLYQQGKFVPKTIFGNNFGLVEFFFPIPVRTYRDDLILLVQHRVDFGTHKLTVLETLIWNGEAFEATIPAPCKLGAHIVHGVGCMLDLQRDAGLKGAALLRRGDEISVIVPRHEAESGLFRLHTKLLDKNSELTDLEEIFSFLKEWVAEQDALIAKAQAFLNAPAAANLPDLSRLQMLKTPELFFSGTIRQLFVNDYKWTQQDSLTDLEFVINEIQQLGNELGINNVQRHRRDTVEADEASVNGHNVEFDSLELDEVFAESLELENLNGEEFFVQNASLNFDGILNLVDLEVLNSELLTPSPQADFEELTLNQDWEFDEINGVAWREIAENLVFRNKPLHLDNLVVEEEVVIEDNLNLERLNSLKFPADYLWSEGVENQIVTATKTFTGTLAANHVDSEGLINGKDPFDIVTLSDPQDWTGTPTFAQLEVSEILELNGTARGRGVDEFPLNPTLEESHTINADCEFTNLKILGALKIEENFNGEPLSELLGDIVQHPAEPNDEILITAPKTFTEVFFPIDFHIRDEVINEIAIDEFIPAHTTQDLNITNLNGNSFFNNLTIKGLYDGIDLQEFLNNTINITQPQVLRETQLNFNNMLNGKQINVVKTLNGVPIDTGFQTINEDLKIPTAHFETLKVAEANIHGPIEGAAKLNGLKMTDTKVEKQTDNAATPTVSNIFIDELILENGLKVDEIQGINATFLYDFLDAADDLPDMVLDGKIHVDNILVDGDVQLNKLNGQNFDEDVQMTAIWLNRPNYLSTNLQFNEPIDLYSHLTVLGDYNGENLVDTIDDMIFKTPHGSILIWAPKNFITPIRVLGNTKLDAINGVPFQSIATKRNVCHFKGNLSINGDLHVQHLVVDGKLNNFSMSNISDRLYFNENLQAFVLRGVTQIYSNLILNDLTVLGDLNEFKNLAYFFENLVYRQGLNLLKGRYNFTGRVTIERGVYINNLNGHHLTDLFNNVIFINGLEPLIFDAPINFTAPIKASHLNIRGDLIANSISGCSIRDWINDTLRLDRAENVTSLINFGPNSLHGNSFYASYLNNIDLSKIITLHTPQNLSADIKFSEVYLDGSITAKGPINGADLQYEYENTVLSYGAQHLKTPLTIQTVFVMEDLETQAPINDDKDLREIATLYENVEFETPLYFENVQVQHLETAEPLSSIDIDKWFEEALWLQGQANQYITGNWRVHELQLQNGPQMPAQVVGSTRSERDTDGEYQKVCQQLKNIVDLLNNRAYYLRHLENAFELNLANELAEQQEAVEQIFLLENKQEIYLLLNLGCQSLLMAWQQEKLVFEKMAKFESGKLKQAFVILADDRDKSKGLKFVSLSAEDECRSQRLNLWLVKNAEIKLIKSYEQSSVTQIWTGVKRGSFYALTVEGLLEISAVEPYAVETIKLDNVSELLNFSFIGYENVTKMYFTNGSHIIQISIEEAVQPKLTKIKPFNFHSNMRRAVRSLTVPNESMLQPNETVIRKLSFVDFSELVERILEDLDLRLSIEVNITQLSIPETDLYDAHLVEDFIAIMDELRLQNIYPAKSFDDIDLSTLKIPANPAQVLAARTVQIVWPVIIEINEVHRYLKGNSTVEHPISGCILNHLGVAVREILSVANANKQQANETNKDYTEDLAAVIKRIRQFQADLQAVKNELQLEILEDLHAEMNSELKNAEQLLEKQNVEVETAPHQNHNLKIFQKSQQQSNNEIVQLVVGEAAAPSILYAVINSRTQLVPGEPAGLNFYTDLMQRQLFQFIPAHKAHFLNALRIRDLTFVAYVEHCCLVNVLQYRGVEGFVEFVKFSTDAPVQQLKTISLPRADLSTGHYLIVVFKRKLIFYEFVFAGLRKVSLEDLNVCF